MGGLEINLVVPDLWQQEAVRALQAGRMSSCRRRPGGQDLHFRAALPVAQRAGDFYRADARPGQRQARGMARARLGRGHRDGRSRVESRRESCGRDAGDAARAFSAPRRSALLVVDEYQMIADPVRGVHYELALALAPPETQLLLLSGSVQNPQDVVAWFQRIGRDAVLVSHDERPVPLEEIDLRVLPESQFVQTKSFWPRMIGKALRADLAPVLVFAPRRNASEEMAQAIASALPLRDPLSLSPQQEALAGKRLSKLLRSRVAYHHSGLSYAVRAGLIEPLAKAGQFNVVVATMGLAAGINFSMRSVLITDTRYMAGNFERHVAAG